MSSRPLGTCVAMRLGWHLPATQLPPSQLRPATQQLAASLMYFGSQVPRRPQGGQLAPTVPPAPPVPTPVPPLPPVAPPEPPVGVSPVPPVDVPPSETVPLVSPPSAPIPRVRVRRPATSSQPAVSESRASVAPRVRITSALPAPARRRGDRAPPATRGRRSLQARR